MSAIVDTRPKGRDGTQIPARALPSGAVPKAIARILRPFTLRLDLSWSLHKRRLIRHWGFVRPYSRKGKA